MSRDTKYLFETERLGFRHWPIILMALATIVCAVEWFGPGQDDTGAAIVVYFVGFILLLPLCSFILSIWYGYRLRSLLKWIITLACGLPSIFLVGIVTKDYKFWTYWQIGLYSLAAALLGMLIGNGIWKLRKLKEK